MTTWQEHFPDLDKTLEQQIEEAVKIDRARICERIIRMIEAEEKLGRWSTELVTDIIRSNYTPVCIGEL